MSYTLDPVIAEHEIVPLGDRILVETDPPKQNERVGSLYVPDQAQDEKIWGTVRALGPDFQVSEERAQDGTEPWIVRPQDRVLFARYGGHDIELPGGGKLVILREEDVVAKLGPKVVSNG